LRRKTASIFYSGHFSAFKRSPVSVD